jgi:flagellar hook-associated protein 3 FlgL
MLQNLSSIGQQFIANLQTLDQQIANTQEQVSSGFQINQPSDDPAEITDLLQLESNLGSANQVVSNLGEVSGQVNTAESALENATQLLQQAGTIAAQGASSTTSASERTDLSQQAEQILTSLVSASQTTYNGTYVFSGDASNSPSYQLDLSNPDGVDRLITATATQKIQDATGVTFADSLTAQTIFDNRNADDSLASNNVFAAVNSLRVALANNDQTGISNAAASINTASDYLSQQLAFYGGVQDQITNATDVAQKFQLQYQTSISQVRDTDMATAAVDLTQEQTSMQAAIQSEAALPKTNLFSYLTGGSGG